MQIKTISEKEDVMGFLPIVEMLDPFLIKLVLMLSQPILYGYGQEN